MILTCVDGSSYDDSVCDHAAWMSGPLDSNVQVIHALEATAGGREARSADRIVRRALGRVTESGAPARGDVRPGEFVAVAQRSGADIVVIGKRGAGSETNPRLLGSHVEPLIRGTEAPVCLSPKVFLPIARSLVLLDADMNHRRAVEFVAERPGLNGLDMDLVVMCEEPEAAAEKLNWARATLRHRQADVFTLPAGGLDEAVMRYMQSRGADLMVVSRAVLLPNAEGRLRQIEADSFWGWRTPVLVC